MKRLDLTFKNLVFYNVASHQSCCSQIICPLYSQIAIHCRCLHCFYFGKVHQHYHVANTYGLGCLKMYITIFSLLQIRIKMVPNIIELQFFLKGTNFYEIK
jgi:hypothetical protein